MTTSTADPAQPTVSTVVVAADGSVTVTQVSNATTVTYPGVVSTTFSPLDLSPTLWLDASDETTITESGGAVSQWDDKSGNDNDLTQATSAKQPTSGTRTLNGLNVLDFDGSDDAMFAATAGDWAFLHDGTTYLLAAVISADVTGSNDVVLATQSGSNEPGFYYGHVIGDKLHRTENAIANAIEAE